MSNQVNPNLPPSSPPPSPARQVNPHAPVPTSPSEAHSAPPADWQTRLQGLSRTQLQMGILLAFGAVLLCGIVTLVAGGLWIGVSALNAPTPTPTLSQAQIREQALTALLDPSLRQNPVLTAQALQMAQAFPLEFYDPVSDERAQWLISEQDWLPWLRAYALGDGVALDVDLASIQAYVQMVLMSNLDATRTLDVASTAQSLADSITSQFSLMPRAIAKHLPRQHSVQAGETLTSIAWEYGIPYIYIQQANGGISDVSIGQNIVIPPADSFLLKPVVPNKRIIVSISQQRVWVMEAGALKWEWVASTGISSSPTWTGIYQIISHVPNAYAANWDLWMPSFLGVYQPVPNSDFTNGFHGFPTRGGGQLLWQSDLGRRVTYGCILLDSVNAQLLYDWAEEGVVVEIQA